MTCNGWRNAATWTVNLWFGNDFAAMAQEQELTPEMCWEVVEEAVSSLVDPDGAAINGFIWDMLDLRSVDWDELCVAACE